MNYCIPYRATINCEYTFKRSGRLMELASINLAIFSCYEHKNTTRSQLKGKLPDATTIIWEVLKSNTDIQTCQRMKHALRGAVP